MNYNRHYRVLVDEIPVFPLPNSPVKITKLIKSGKSYSFIRIGLWEEKIKFHRGNMIQVSLFFFPVLGKASELGSPRNRNEFLHSLQRSDAFPGRQRLLSSLYSENINGTENFYFLKKKN